MTVVSNGSDRHPRATLAHECGLSKPKPPLLAWPPDPHLALAVLAAIPVWLALALTLGERMRLPSGPAAWASLVLVQPVVEELVFRGVLQGQLLRLTAARRFGPLTLANLMVTAGFVGAHLLTQPPGWALAVAVPSLVFGHLRERFRSVAPAIAMHALYNAGFGLAAWLARG
jgi:membrane protease YdiL (CAAX protease family)